MLKGKMTIELTDVKTGEKEVVEDQRLYAFSKPARNRAKKNER